MSSAVPRRGSWLARPVVMLMIGCAGGDAPAPGAHVKTHTVEIRGMGFDPPELLARPGDTIIWINRDIVPHTATEADSAWGSPTLEVGDRWSMVAGAEGVMDYLCALHPPMRARAIIESAHPEPAHD